MSRETERFRVYRTDETRIETGGELLGWGAAFPTGECAVMWNREAFEPDDRLDHEHMSLYGSIADVEQGTGGSVEMLDTLDRGDLIKGEA